MVARLAERRVRVPHRPRVDAAGRERGLGVGGREEHERDVACGQVGLFQRGEREIVADGAARRRETLALQTRDVRERRMRTDDDRKIERIRACRGDRPHPRAGCEREHERRVAEAADVHGARVQCFAKRLRCRKIEPFDLVRQVFQLAGRFENAARLQRLVADLEHG